MHGKGAQMEADGSVYDGDYRNGAMHGTGTYTFGKDGSKLAGWEWVQPGDRYDGPFVEHGFDGVGWWTYAKDAETVTIETKNDKLVSLDTFYSC